MTATTPTNGNGRLSLILTTVGVVIMIGGPFVTLMIAISNVSQTTTALASRVATVEAQDNGTKIAKIERDLIEIETQFCAEDSMRNLTHANDLRLLGMIWPKVTGMDLPSANAYYPKIGRCGPDAK